ncbi:MAG: hypothetical protein JWL81_2435 [Verrucomicrobiales bacterium]|nr:hypothetical protein [Verrucomicrobiales bacterium]
MSACESESISGPGRCPGCGRGMVDIGLGPQCLNCLMEVALREPASLPSPGHSFGEYELHEEMGRGGMGVVCRAWQPQLSRWVALKMLIGGVFAQPEFLERFRRESMAAARIKHAGIAVVYDVGERDGQAFYTMELLEGGSLADWIASGNSDVRAAAGMVEQTARAIAFAHQHGVLHRDLKPSNILLGPDGRPKVVDFGLALVLEETEEISALPALTQTTLGTPAYMAPEVAEGGRAGVAADIFALGAVLFEMLTGRPPHSGRNTQAVLLKARSGMVEDPSRVNPLVPPDLAKICLKCLDREPAARYLSGDQLADDLVRFLEGKPVLARPVGAVEQIWRWARRNRVVAGLAAALFLTLVGGSVSVVRQAAKNQIQGQALKRQEEELGQANGRLARQVYASDMRAAFQDFSAGNPAGAKDWLRTHIDSNEKGVEWGWLWRHSAGEQARELHRGSTPQSAVSFFPDGRHLVKITSDGKVSVGGAEQDAWRETGIQVQWRPQFSAATGRLYYCREGKVRSCVLGDNGSAGPEAEGPAALQISLAPGGRWAALGSVWSAFYRRGGGGVASVMDLSDGTIVWQAPEAEVCRMAVSADGRFLATAGRTGGVVLWDVPGRRSVRRWEIPPVSNLQFSPDGLHLAAGGTGGAWLLNPAGAEIVNLPHSGGHQVTETAFSTNSQSLATACTDRGVRVWSVAHPQEPIILRGHESEVWGVGWNPDGKSLASCGRDGLVLLWNAQHIVPPEIKVPGRFQRPWFAPDSRSVISSAGFYPEVISGRWRCDGTMLETYPKNSQSIGLNQSDEAILLNFGTGRIEWWPQGVAAPSRGMAMPQASTLYACQTLISPDGGTLSVLDNTGLLTLHDTRENAGNEPRRIPVFPRDAGAPRLEVRAGGWSGNGRHLAFASNQVPFAVQWIDVAALTVRPLAGARDQLTGLAFSADGRWLAACEVNGPILVWEIADLSREPLRLAGHDRNTADVVFSPDCRTLMSLGTLDGVKFWHAATWRELGSIPIPDAASHLAVSPDGAWLAVTCGLEGKPERARIIPLR